MTQTETLAEWESRIFKCQVCEWHGQLRCIYLDGYRIAGGKPWGGGVTVAEFKVRGSDILSVFPELRAMLARADQVQPRERAKSRKST